MTGRPDTKPPEPWLLHRVATTYCGDFHSITCVTCEISLGGNGDKVFAAPVEVHLPDDPDRQANIRSGAMGPGYAAGAPTYCLPCALDRGVASFVKGPLTDEEDTVPGLLVEGVAAAASGCVDQWLVDDWDAYVNERYDRFRGQYGLSLILLGAGPELIDRYLSKD